MMTPISSRIYEMEKKSKILSSKALSQALPSPDRTENGTGRLVALSPLPSNGIRLMSGMVTSTPPCFRGMTTTTPGLKSSRLSLYMRPSRGRNPTALRNLITSLVVVGFLIWRPESVTKERTVFACKICLL